MWCLNLAVNLTTTVMGNHFQPAPVLAETPDPVNNLSSACSKRVSDCTFTEAMASMGIGVAC